MPIKLLIADPENTWLTQAQEFFEKDMYEIFKYNNGKDTQVSVYNNKFAAAIINADVENHSAIQVLNYIKSHKPNLNVIVTLGIKTKKNDIQKLEKLGYKYFLKKPFSFIDLRKMIESIQDIDQVVSNMTIRDGQSAEEDINESDSEFTKIQIDDLFSGKPVLFDLFIQLNNNHYVKILHEGDTFSNERINRYKDEKGIEYLHFKTKDRKKYIKFTNRLVSKLATGKSVSTKVKVSMLKSASEKFLEEVCTEGMEPAILDEGASVCQNIAEVIEFEDSLHVLLRGFDDFDPRAVSHAFAITFFSSIILKQLKWNSKKTVDTMSMACMFHDLGKSKLSPALLDLRPQNMNPEQLQEYKTHSMAGSEMLAKEKGINSIVREIIGQHHEYFDGNGFPNNLKGNQISNQAKIICLANDFVHIITDNNITPVDGIKKILSSEESVRRYDPNILENFMRAFIDPQKLVA